MLNKITWTIIGLVVALGMGFCSIGIATNIMMLMHIANHTLRGQIDLMAGIAGFVYGVIMMKKLYDNNKIEA